MDSELKGRVILVQRKRVVCDVNGVEYFCRYQTRFLKERKTFKNVAAVGDIVKIQTTNEFEGIINEVLPRHNVLSRPSVIDNSIEQVIASNIDHLLIVASVKEPLLKSGLIDRFLVIAEKNNINALIAINKIDLGNDSIVNKYTDLYSSLDYPVFKVSAKLSKGIQALNEVLMDKTTIFSGHSGVGKSSLLNTLTGSILERTKEVSKKTGKGKHTTSYVRMYTLSQGGFVIDTPGIKELGLMGVDRQNLGKYFKEFTEYSDDCKFKNCIHHTEPGCAVKDALEEERISRERYSNYLKLMNSLE